MRVFLADDQPEVRSALKLLLEQEPDVWVVDEAVDFAGLLAQIGAAAPDLVLLDWELPGFQASTCLPVLRRLCPKLVIVAASGRLEAVRAARAAGVDAFVSKGGPPDELMATLRSIHSGQTGVPHRSC